jgi:hypothetical protein
MGDREFGEHSYIGVTLNNIEQGIDGIEVKLMNMVNHIESETQIWLKFAVAAIACGNTPADAASIAEKMMNEYRQRWEPWKPE